MNIVNKSIQKIHQITGLIIALFFIMWFVTGIILLYHKYPRVTQSDYYSHAEALSLNELPAVYDIPDLADSSKVKTLMVNRNLGQTVWTISGVSNRKENPMDVKPEISNKFIVTGDTLFSQSKVTLSQLDSIACVWAGSKSILKVDTLNERQQWILYERYDRSLPILKYYFDNPEKSEIYISQKSGEVLQATTKSERAWSWVGAIPHKLYFTFLRTDVDRWKNALLIGGLLCLVASLSGLYLGIYFLFVSKRKQHKFASPFKKHVWRYHHIAGLIFGIFLVAWGISGSLAMQRVPKWLVNYDGDYFVSASKLWGRKPLPLKDYKLDYREILKKYPDVKSISWEHFGKIPAYLVVSGEKELYVDASIATSVELLEIPKVEIENAITRYFGDDVKYSIALQEDYDEYYLSTPGDYPLPVWKVDVENSDGTRMYISPSDGYVKYLNDNRMAKKWLFAATHYLDIKYFVLHRSLRYACLWILSIACVSIIVTGIIIFFSKGKSDRLNNRKK